MKICNIEGCNNKHKAKGYCNKHYSIYLKYGDPLLKKVYPTECTVDGCNKKHFAKGFCEKHYRRFKDHGDPLYEHIIIKKTCSVEGCNKEVTSKGFCEKHYRRFRKYGDPLYTSKDMDRDPICKVEGCNNKHDSLGYCAKHYLRFKRHNDLLYERFDRGIEYHGMTNTPEYSVWSNMKQRCYNPKSINYHRYGGRGITVCDRWNNSFIAFYEDMGNRPFPEAQLDREKNDLGYYKDNCRWVTPIVNARNSTATKLNKNKVIDIRAKKKTGKYSNKDLGLEYNVHEETIRNIVNNAQWIML